MSFLSMISILSILTSSSLVIYKNHKANKNIEKNGYEITKDKRSIKDIYFTNLKELSYLFIPGVNLLASIYDYSKDDNVYMNERLNKLISYGRVTKKEENSPKEEKVEIKKEEYKKPKEEIKEVPIEKKSTIEQIKYYESMVREYRHLYDVLKSEEGHVEQKNDLVRKTIEVDKKLASLYRQLEINRLKDERDRVLDSKVRTK